MTEDSFPGGGSARVPTALTIAGSDSGGGAGIQADLKTFAALGVHGASAVTCLTAQNPAGVRGIQPCSPRMIRGQIEAVFEGFSPAAVKTGMLYSDAIIRQVAGRLHGRRATPLVVDPVMVAGSGALLLKPAAVKSLVARLIPLATVVTPNLDETRVLLGWKPSNVDEARQAARELHRLYGCGVLVKGGHFRGSAEAVDVLFDGRQETLLKARRIERKQTHGTGCTLSAAITARLARGDSLIKAVQFAKRYVTEAIARSRNTGRHAVLHHLWKVQRL